MSRRATIHTDERRKDTQTHAQAIMSVVLIAISLLIIINCGSHFNHYHPLHHHHHLHCQKYLDNRSHSGLHRLVSGIAGQAVGDFKLTSSSVKWFQCQKWPTGDLASFVFLDGPHPLFALLTKLKFLRLIRETRVIL